MEHSLKTGFCFGMTSGVITTLGLMVGLHSGTHSELVVIGGILTIAVADAFSDALGIHISEESENMHTGREIWTSTASTFLSKLVVALTFIVPTLLLDLSTAMVVSVIWGLALLSFLSFYVGKEEKGKPLKVVAEHVAIAVIVIVIAHYVGDLIALTFG